MMKGTAILSFNRGPSSATSSSPMRSIGPHPKRSLPCSKPCRSRRSRSPDSKDATVRLAGAQSRLQSPFLVLATQNPLEMDGTYPLPEAQLDRFFLKLQVSYPSFEDLSEIVDRTTQRQERLLEPILQEAK